MVESKIFAMTYHHLQNGVGFERKIGEKSVVPKWCPLMKNRLVKRKSDKK